MTSLSIKSKYLKKGHQILKINMAEVSTFKKIVAILPLFLFDIILPTVDIGTDAVLISKLYTTKYVCIDDDYETCNINKGRHPKKNLQIW